MSEKVKYADTKCRVCRGSGRRWIVFKCSGCGGSGKVIKAYAPGGRTLCPLCVFKDTKKQPDPNCNCCEGSGLMPKKLVERKRACPKCAGYGFLLDNPTKPTTWSQCPRCRGSGKK